MNRLGFALAGALLVAGAAAARPDVVTLAPDRDNTLFEDPTGSLSDGAGPVMFSGNNGQDLARRALLRFDIAGNLPLGARIDAVELRLNCSNASNATPRTFTLHRVLADWGEGASTTTSGSGAPAATGDATWLHTFYPGSFWTAPGGDFAGLASATQTVADVGSYAWSDPGMKTDVQEWLNGTAANDGWLLLGDETALNTARRFDTRENATLANRPVLTIQYAFNTTGVAVPATNGSFPRLEPPVPNPTAGASRLGFVLAADGQARVTVDDVAGRRIATLVQGRFGPGRSEAHWDGLDPAGRPVPAGIYLCRLVVDGRVAATRILARLR